MWKAVENEEMGGPTQTLATADSYMELLEKLKASTPEEVIKRVEKDEGFWVEIYHEQETQISGKEGQRPE